MGSCHKNYNFLDCNWFKKLLFSTNSVFKFTIGQFVIGQLVIGQFVIGQFNKPITFKVFFFFFQKVSRITLQVTFLSLILLLKLIITIIIIIIIIIITN